MFPRINNTAHQRGSKEPYQFGSSCLEAAIKRDGEFLTSIRKIWFKSSSMFNELNFHLLSHLEEWVAPVDWSWSAPVACARDLKASRRFQHLECGRGLGFGVYYVERSPLTSSNQTSSYIDASVTSIISIDFEP